MRVGLRLMESERSIISSKIWDIRTKKMVTNLRSPLGSGGILDCCYDESCGMIFAGSQNGMLCKWI